MADTQKDYAPVFRKQHLRTGRQLFDHLLTRASQLHPNTQSGCFGADMQVHLCNDGPVTFLLQF